jgi:hypothetical protein
MLIRQAYKRSGNGESVNALAGYGLQPRLLAPFRRERTVEAPGVYWQAGGC